MTTEKMTLLAWLPEIALPPAYRRRADDAMHVARNGLIKLINRFGDPEDVAKRNHVEHRAIAWARMQLRRLTDIVRCTLALFAIYLDVAPAKPRVSKAGAHTPAKPVGSESKTWRVRLRFLQNCNAPKDDARSPPFATTTHDPLRSLARSMEALRRVLGDPMPHARRLARAIRTSLVVPRDLQLKRTPQDDAYFADRREIRHTLVSALDMHYRPRRYRDDSS